MSEELNQNTEQEAPEQKEISPVEQKALELGWRPKEEFSGNEEDFIDAKEFVARQPFFEKISHQNKQIKELHKSLEAFKQHYTMVEKSAYERALQDLKASRRQALTDGDGDRFDAIDTEIKRVEKQVEILEDVRQAPVAETPDQLPPAFASWVSQNRWYETTKYMRDFADDFGKSLHARGMAPDEVLKEVTAAVKKEFPHKFTNPNRAAAPIVGTPGAGASPKRENLKAQLNEQELKIMNTLVRGEVLTEEKYLADLAATGRFKK